MNSESFYNDLIAFADFAGIAEANNYRVAPDDWHVVIADVVQSTQAIADGRYKEVNLIGAACINAVLNISRKKSIPYVFGGDGATLMVPPDRLEDATRALLGVRALAAEKFHLDLRVGVVPVAEIHSRTSARVLVGKYHLSPGNDLGVFSGGGIETAEAWIKSDEAWLLAKPPGDESVDLSGLSCRWEPLAAQNGTMLSVLIQATAGDSSANAELYRTLIAEIDSITESAAGNAKPICAQNMQLRWPPQNLRNEILATRGERNVWIHGAAVTLNTILQWLLDRFDIHAGGYRGKQYRDELRDNTDYRRFDDTLRILIDCSLEQATAIDDLLSAHAGQGRLRFGLHRSDSALMTCLVFNLDKGEHVHFVDGSDGGFTAAAKRMKAAGRNRADSA